MQATCEEASEVVKGGQIDVLSGAGPLHTAAGSGQTEATSLLLQHGAPVDGPDGHGHTALQVNYSLDVFVAGLIVLKAPSFKLT